MLTANTCQLLLARLRENGPLIQIITNFVSMEMCANVLLALGASPAMVFAKAEAGDFQARAQGLCINMGTLSAPFLAGMKAAARAADEKGKPWLLDPVGVGGSPYRTKACLDMLAMHPKVVRANASEVLALARAAGHLPAKAQASDGNGSLDRPFGVDSRHMPLEALESARFLARGFGAVVAITGARDIITDGTRVVVLPFGHPLMAKITAMGCALSASIAAMLAVEADTFLATAAMVALYGWFGACAGKALDTGTSVGPGTFKVAFLDAVYGAADFMSAAEFDERLNAAN